MKSFKVIRTSEIEFFTQISESSDSIGVLDIVDLEDWKSSERKRCLCVENLNLRRKVRKFNEKSKNLKKNQKNLIFLRKIEFFLLTSFDIRPICHLIPAIIEIDVVQLEDPSKRFSSTTEIEVVNFVTHFNLFFCEIFNFSVFFDSRANAN